MKRVKDTICPRIPKIRKKLEGIRNHTRHCMFKPVVYEIFQVAMFSVELRAHECSCRWWTLIGILFELSCHYVFIRANLLV